MAKFSNLLVMLGLLNTGRKYSVKELSDYLEVSDQNRDLQYVAEQLAPLEVGFCHEVYRRWSLRAK